MTDLLEEARRSSARAVNALMTASDWQIDPRIVRLFPAGRPAHDKGDRQNFMAKRTRARLQARPNPMSVGGIAVKIMDNRGLESLELMEITP
jgi:hypothetical protein